MVTRRVRLLALAFFALPSLLLAQPPSLARTDYSSHAGARSIASADFNRDGWLDLAHANNGRDSVTVLLNNSTDRSLAVTTEIPVGHGPFDMVAADFNRDGAADLAVANADGDSLSVLIGDGRGGFSRTDIAAAGNPRGITAADMNADGKPDIIYTAFMHNRVQILNGDGAGGFALGWSMVGVADRPQGVAAADFNRDGRMDLAVAYVSFGGGLAILHGSLSGSLSAQLIPGLENLNVVTTADLNRDGWADVAAASTGYNTLGVFHGGPTGVTHRVSYVTGVSPRGIATADLDRNGRQDILVANKESSTISAFMARETGDQLYEGFEVAAGLGSRAIVTGDFNHDGLSDVAVANQDAPSATLYSNTSTASGGGFAFEKLDGSYGFDVFPDDVVIGDFDEDGRLDRLNARAGTISFGNGTQGSLPAGAGGLVTEVNSDGHADLVFLRSTGVGTWLGNGHGEFTQGPVSNAWSSSISTDAMQPADFDRDGKIDVVAKGHYWTGTENAGVRMFAKGNGDGTFQAAIVTPNPPGGWMAVGDVNGDGILDILESFWMGQDTNRFLLVSHGDGTGAFSEAQRLSTLSAIMVTAHVADLNHDGRADVVASTFDGTHVFLGQADGTLRDPVVYPDFSYRVALGDVNGDGHMDIVGNSTVVVRVGRGDGTFGEGQAFASFVAQPVVVDMNNDGLNDIVVGDGGAGVLLNLRRTTNTPPTVTAPDDLTVSYVDTFNDDDENTIFITPQYFDADLHWLRFEWRDSSGTLLGSNLSLRLPQFLPGTYELTVTAFDDRGGVASDRMLLTITPVKEIVLYAFRGGTATGWTRVNDPTAALGLRIENPDRGSAKVTTPLAAPTEYFDLWFLADPTQEYKLWVRGKAQDDSWASDSAWIQFEHSLNAAGEAAYRIGTADGLPFNLEECSGCGLSGWGWEDDGWGSVDAPGVRIRFAQGGWQRLRVQKREDGVSIDQIVLSAERFLTTRPGTAKNDSTILPERFR